MNKVQSCHGIGRHVNIMMIRWGNKWCQTLPMATPKQQGDDSGKPVNHRKGILTTTQIHCEWTTLNS